MVCTGRAQLGGNRIGGSILRLAGRIPILAAILAFGPSDPAEADFARQMQFTVGAGQVSGGPLANFPVLVSVQDPDLATAGNGGVVTSDVGNDVQFWGDAAACGGAACILDHEIELYDGSNGTLVAWVRVPSLNNGIVIDLYYGDAAVGCSLQNTAAVWDSGFREVFHLHETGEHTDSTLNAFTAVTRGAVTQAATGKIGPADEFFGGATDKAWLIASDTNITTTDSLTFEAWAYFRSYVPGGYVGIVMKGRECYNFDGSPSVGFGDCTAAPCGDWVGLYKGGADKFSFGWTWGSVCKAGNMVDAVSPGTVGLNQWYHVAATYNQATSTRTLYVDGQQVATDTVGACVEADIPHYTLIGNDNLENDYMDGFIDEVRISSSVRSGNWIQTSYNNQNAPGAGGFFSTISDGPSVGVNAACSAPPVNPCDGGPGSCNLRSIGDTTPYATGSGTCTATTGSPVVSCPGAGWQSANRGRGDRITIEGTDYMVQAVTSESSLTLSTPFTGAGGVGTVSYTMSRQFTTLGAWEACITGGAACPYFTVADGNLVTGTRSEIGIVYDDGSSYVPPGGSPILNISGATTDETHTITLTADPGNRHLGRAGDGVVLDNTGNTDRAVVIQDQYVTLEWLEILGGFDNGDHCLDYIPSDAANHAVFRHNLIHDCTGQSIRLAGGSSVFVADIVGNIIYGGNREAIALGASLGTGTGSRVRVLNNTMYRNNPGGTQISTFETPNPYLVLRNNIIVDDTSSPDFHWNDGTSPCTYAPDCDWANVASSHNISGDPAPATGKWKSDVGHSPRGGGVYGATEAGLDFVDTTPGSEDLHIQPFSLAWGAAANLGGLVDIDIDAIARVNPWDVGADEVTTGAALPLIAYSDSSGSSPRPLKFSTYQAGTWSAPGADGVPSDFDGGGAPLHQKAAVASPVHNTRAVVFAEDNPGTRDYLHASFWDGAAWGDGTSAPVGQAYGFGTWGRNGTLNTRFFDAAYEQASGRLLVVAGTNTDGLIKNWHYTRPVGTPPPYGTWTTLPNEIINTCNPNQNYFDFVHLAARPSTNQIAFVGLGSEGVLSPSYGSIQVAVWDGDSATWGSKTTFNGCTGGVNTTEAVDVKFVLAGPYEGQAVAVGGDGQYVYSKIWNPSSGTWGSSTQIANLGANSPLWLRLAAQPTGGRMVLGIQDTTGRIGALRYDPSLVPPADWVVASANVESFPFGNPADNRPFDLVWDPAGGANNALLVYSDTTGLRYRVSTDAGESWGAEQTITTSYQAYWVQLERDPTDIIHLAIHDDGDNLRAWTWDGATWTVSTPTPISSAPPGLESDASHNVESFTLATYPPLGYSTTEVELLSFGALPVDSAVDLSWRTGSELRNLGFHLHRSLSESGPWTRITPSLIPGLGSSPEGASYSFRDTGLTNGVRYFYRLEDIDSESGSTFHGPVSAVPGAAPPADDEGSAGSDGSDEGEESDPSTADSPGDVTPQTYGRPEDVSFRVVSRTKRAVVVELRTPGFVATPSPEGLHVSVPGFDQPTDPRAADLPLKRVVLDGVVGRHARIVWVKEKETLSFPGLTPAAVGAAVIVSSPDGTVRPGRRAAALRGEGVLPPYAARIPGDAFIGETKKLALEMNPIRYDASSDTLLLAQTLRVKIAFDRRVTRSESGRGSRGRRRPRSVEDSAPQVLAHLHTVTKGLHAVSFETLFPQGHQTLPLDSLRLSLQGRSVAFHVEPKGKTFGPGSVLFFHSSTEARSTDYFPEVAYALEQAPGGLTMPSLSASPRGAKAPVSASLAAESFETNRSYQAGLLEAPDPWLWDFLLGGMSKSWPLALDGVDSTSTAPAQLQVLLQGASEADTDGDHHLSVSWNGLPLGETTFDGKLPHVFSTSLPVSSLQEGENALTVTNLGDTGVYSFVLLDRVDLVYPQRPSLRSGRFGGVFSETGEVVVDGEAPFGVDVTDPEAPVWLSSLRPRGGSVSLRVEAGHRYELASGEGLLVPRVSAPLRSTLRRSTNQAEYVVIAPEAFLEAARP
ncbi:MAG: hypothetical protein PVJ73_10480, partial [Acidobacteriota bacterium]